MKSASVCLLDDQLRSLLEEDLLPQEAADCEAHLANCPRCRDKVESLIGNADWWQEAEDSLRSPQDRTATIPPEKLSSIAPHADILRLLGPTDNPQMLGRIGSYEIVGILGRGGMGVVFKGFDPALNRFVAIKMLAPHLAASGAARKRFEREAQAAAAIVHDHVMAIHGVADWQGTPYLVMPYVRGASLQKRIDDQGPFQLREILRIGMQTAAGLAAAHAQGLVHRDIKPANIMLASGVERVALTDFGLARAVDDATLTRTGTLAGTPQYMSPEQARGQAVDFRSDLFSLGSVLYTLCTGRPPFRAETSYGILRLITDEEPRPIQQLSPDIPVWLCTLIGRLMAKNPADRFASAEEVSKLLEKCLAYVEQPSLVALPIELLPPAPAIAPHAQAPSRTFSKRSIAIACGLLLAVIGVCFGVLATNPPEIAGTWQGEDWGTVVLKSEAAGQYAGEFSETVGKVPGQLHLKWSRIERRYNGTWKDGDERLGDLSLRLVDQQIRGAYSTSEHSKTNPATPRLADFTWTRTTPPTASNASPPSKVAKAEPATSSSNCDLAFFDPGIYRLSIHARRRTNENPEAGPFIRECGSQVVEVKPEDVSQLIAKLSFFTLPSENLKDPGTLGFRLLSGTLVRSLGDQVLRDQTSWKVSPDLPEVIHCVHQSVTPLATYQDGSRLVQLELHVQRWAPDDTTAPKENRVSLSASGYAPLLPVTEDWYRENPFIELPNIDLPGKNSRLIVIANYPPAQKDLQLTSEQISDAIFLAGELRKSREANDNFADSEVRFRKLLQNTFSQKQLRRLSDLEIQSRDYIAFRYLLFPKGRLNLNQLQIVAIEHAIQTFEHKIDEISSSKKSADPDEQFLKLKKFTKQDAGRQHLLTLWQTIHDILSVEQRQKFNEFRGDALNKLTQHLTPKKELDYVACAVVQEMQTMRVDGKRFLGLTVPQNYVANVALIARSKNASRVLRRFHVISQKGMAVAWLHWEIETSEQAGTFPMLEENYEVSPANKEDGTPPTSLASPESLIIEPRLFNPQTREKAEETNINLVVPFVGGSDLPLEVASGETKEALLFFDVSADQIEHEIWLRVSLDTLPQNIRTQNTFHAALGSSWKTLRYPRPESETADVELSIPLSNEGYDLPLNPGLLNEDLNVQMQQLELLAPYTQGAGLDGSHDLVLQTPSGLKPEVLASTTLAFSHHTKMRIRTRPAESKNLRTLAPPSAEQIKEAFSKALQGNWKCLNITETSLNVSSELKNIESLQFAGQQMHTIALGQKPEEKSTATFEIDASHYPAWITVKSENELVLGIFSFSDGKLQLLFGNAKDRPAQLLSSASAISLLLEKVPEPTDPNSVANATKPAAKVLADKVVIKSARTDRNHLLVDIEMNVALTPSWLRSLYLGPDRPLTSADVQNRTHDYPLVSSVSDWPVNANYQLSPGSQSQRFAFLFPSNEAASLALKQVDDLSRKGPQTLTANTALQLFRVEYDDKTYQGGIDIREGAAASTNLNAPVRLTLFVPYTFTLNDWKKFAAELEGPDVRILITQDAKGRNRPIQASLKIDPKYSSHDLRPITDALEKLGLPSLPKESTRKEPEQDHE